MRSTILLPVGSALALAVVLGACGKKEEPTPTIQEVPVTLPQNGVQAPSAGATGPATAATVTAATVTARVLPENPETQIPETEIPTEEDYEAEAEKLISGDNLDDALDELEREIGG